MTYLYQWKTNVKKNIRNFHKIFDETAKKINDHIKKLLLNRKFVNAKCWKHYSKKKFKTFKKSSLTQSLEKNVKQLKVTKTKKEYKTKKRDILDRNVNDHVKKSTKTKKFRWNKKKVVFKKILQFLNEIEILFSFQKFQKKIFFCCLCHKKNQRLNYFRIINRISHSTNFIWYLLKKRNLSTSH